jgi:SpoVK/Ycf46/Vps4 family AAA+-type ATPase
MQEKVKPVFVVATANDVTQLPAELLRKGRFDELFFVDLPTQQERESIWRIVVAGCNRNPDDFDIVQLARMSEGATGAEIKAVFQDAMFAAFGSDQQPTDLHIATVYNDFVPLSKMMAEQIVGLKQWSKGRARLATSTPISERKLRKLAG